MQSRYVIAAALSSAAVLACGGAAPKSDKQGSGVPGPGVPSPAGQCEQAKLIALGESLARLPEREQIIQVWVGLRAACELPDAIVAFYEHGLERPVLTDSQRAQLDTLRERGCPEWGRSASEIIDDAPDDQRATAAYRACRFERHGVLAEYEVRGPSITLVSWSMHQWLLDQGLSSAQAKPITRALMARERWVDAVVTPLPGQRLPSGTGVPVELGLGIHVTRDAIRFADVEVLLEQGNIPASSLEAGVIERLSAALLADPRRTEFESRGEAWDPPMLVAADVDTPYATLLALLDTLARAGFERSGVLVDASPLGVGQLPRVLGTDGTAIVGPVLSIELGPSSLSLGEGRGEGAEIGVGKLDAISERAAAFANAHRDAMSVVISADPSTSLQAVVDVIAAARGPACDVYGAECVLRDAVLLAEGAHRAAVSP